MIKKILKITGSVAIILIIGLILVPTHRCNPEKARLAKTKSVIWSLNTAIDQFKVDTGFYPDPKNMLSDLIDNPGLENWGGPYLVKNLIPLDPWRNNYYYEVINGIPRIISPGKDKKLKSLDDVEVGGRQKLSEPVN